MTRTSLFQTYRTQAAEVPKDVACPPGDRDIAVSRDGPCRVIEPAETAWDNFFEGAGVEIKQDQPERQVRDPL